jgi:ribose transport system ATP-binding protein
MPAAGPGALTEPLVRLRGMSKRFGATYALRDVGLELHGGQVHGLVGANGSGKSTLVKILAGYHDPEPGGRAELHGEPADLPLRAAVLEQARVGFVHQHLGLVPELSVLENLWLTRISQAHAARLPWRELRRRGAQVLHDYEVDLDPRAQVSDLSQAERALLAIARAAASVEGSMSMPGTREPDEHSKRSAPGVLVLDEATVFLPAKDRELLQRIVRRVTASGGAVLVITHDLDEVVALSDRILILRDGVAVALVERADADRATLARLIVGHALDDGSRRAAGSQPVARTDPAAGSDLAASPNPPVPHAPVPDPGVPAAPVPAAAVEVSALHSARHGVADVSFRVAPGEILGFAGLVGSGFDQVTGLVFGAQSAEGGSIRVGSWQSALADVTPPGAISAGLAYIPADRGSAGLMLDLTVAENVLAQVHARYLRHGFLRRGPMRARAQQIVAELQIRCRSVDMTCAELSGGNQQKVVLGKWLEAQPRVLLLHEPTQGIDVGAREMIWAKLRELAAAGLAVICASSDHEELARLATRVVVMRHGRVTTELRGDDLTKTAVTAACLA